MWLTSLTVRSWRYERVSRTRTPGSCLDCGVLQLAHRDYRAGPCGSPRRSCRLGERPRERHGHTGEGDKAELTAKAPADGDHAANLPHDGERHRGGGPELPAFRTGGETQNAFGRVEAVRLPETEEWRLVHPSPRVAAERNADTSSRRRSMRASWERWSRAKHAACSPIASRSFLGMASTTVTISATERTVLPQ